MYDFEKEATVLLNDNRQVKLDGFYKSECTHIAVNRQWVSFLCGVKYLFGVRFINGKLELLLDERARRYHDPQIWAVAECRPIDDVSSNVLRELFEDRACAGNGIFVKKVPLVWPW